MSKKVCTVDGCDYCPFFEKLAVQEETKKNPLIDADFYKCNKLQICVEADKIYLKKPMKHLFSFCPLEDVFYIQK